MGDDGDVRPDGWRELGILVGIWLGLLVVTTTIAVMLPPVRLLILFSGHAAGCLVTSLLIASYLVRRPGQG